MDRYVIYSNLEKMLTARLAAREIAFAGMLSIALAKEYLDLIGEIEVKGFKGGKLYV